MSAGVLPGMGAHDHDPLRNNLPRIQLEKVTISIVPKILNALANNYQASQQVPTQGHMKIGVVLSLDGKKKSISCIRDQWARVYDSTEYTILEYTLVRMAAKKPLPKENLSRKGRWPVFKNIADRLNTKITHRFNQLYNTKAFQNRLQKRAKKSLRTKHLEEMRIVFQKAIGILRKQDVIELWDYESRLKVIEDVMEA